MNNPNPSTAADSRPIDDVSALLKFADPDVERGLVGRLLDNSRNSDLVDAVLASVPAAAFFDRHCQAAWEVMVDLRAAGREADVFTVANRVQHGPVAFPDPHRWTTARVDEARDLSFSSAEAAKIVNDAAGIRVLGQTVVEFSAKARRGEDSASVSAGLAQALIGLADRSVGAEAVRPTNLINDILEAAEAGRQPDDPTLPRFGYADLDARQCGLRPGQSVIVAGRPGSGKTTMLQDLVRQSTITQLLPTVFISLEMSALELVVRLLAARAKVNLASLLNGGLTDDEWNRIGMVLDVMHAAPLYIYDSPHLTMREIGRIVRAHARSAEGLSLVCIDYLQLMRGDGRSESRQQEVSEISRSIKLLAKECAVPIVSACQLNRGSEGRADKTPQLSDLRESGSLEQDADQVILVHRPDQHDPEHPRAGEADVILAKGRNLKTGTSTVTFQGHYARFVDHAPEGQAA